MGTNWNYIEDVDVPTIRSLESVFNNLISIAIGLVGLITFIMILIGGFKYLSSAGDSKKTEVAKATITQGIIGLVLTVAAYFILLAISRFTGAESILNFTVGGIGGF